MVAPNKLSVNRTKKESQHDVEFAEGGDTKMFSQQAAGPEKPATTAQTENPAPGAKFAAGGKTRMFGYNASQPAKAGQTGAR